LKGPRGPFKGPGGRALDKVRFIGLHRHGDAVGAVDPAAGSRVRARAVPPAPGILLKDPGVLSKDPGFFKRNPGSFKRTPRSF